MGGISVGGGHGGKKSVDSEIPLVPFIDLLLCCVMFLLVTAVWNRLARLDANQEIPGQSTAEPPPEPAEPPVRTYLHVRADGYSIASTLGDNTAIPKVGDQFDIETLRTRLRERHDLYRDRNDLIVAPEDGILYHDVVRAMDIAVGAGFVDVSLSDGAAL